MPEHPERIEQQFRFLIEIDKAKNVLRQTLIADGSRRENDAEHSWHLAMMAAVLNEYAEEPVDLLRVIKMLLVHDLVEIDAGDTFVYDEAGNSTKLEREKAAAERIFGLLPPDQQAEFRTLWEEFESLSTPEARFAAALDRLHPMLLNYCTEGGTWRRHRITKEQVVAKNRPIEKGSAALWRFACGLIEDAVARGFLSTGESARSQTNGAGATITEPSESPPL